MNQNFPYEEIIHEFNELLQFVADHADQPLKKEIPSDIEAKLNKLEKQIEQFSHLSKGFISQMGITDEDMQAYITKTGAAPPRKRTHKIFERTEKLKEQIEEKKKFLETLPKQASTQQDVSLSDKKELDKKSPSTRKSLFKRVGGNKNWRPI